MSETKKSTPTPTQEENDRANRGENLLEHADDGSGPDPHDPAHPDHPQHKKHVEAAASKPSGGGYQTRQAQARAHANAKRMNRFYNNPGLSPAQGRGIITLAVAAITAVGCRSGSAVNEWWQLGYDPVGQQ